MSKLTRNIQLAGYYGGGRYKYSDKLIKYLANELEERSERAVYERFHWIVTQNEETQKSDRNFVLRYAKKWNLLKEDK